MKGTKFNFKDLCEEDEYLSGFDQWEGCVEKSVLHYVIKKNFTFSVIMSTSKVVFFLQIIYTLQMGVCGSLKLLSVKVFLALLILI